MTKTGESNVIVADADLERLRGGFRGDLIRPGDDAYDDARKVWNGSIDKYPALVARCTGVADVMAAVRFARDQELLVAVRGGAHNIAGLGTCDGGIVIDLGPMKGMRVDPAGKTAALGGGEVGRRRDHGRDPDRAKRAASPPETGRFSTSEQH